MERCWNGDDYPMGIWNVVGTLVERWLDICFPKRRSHELTANYVIVDTKDHTKQSHAALLIAMAISLTVTVVQQLSIVGMFSLEWPEPMKGCIKWQITESNCHHQFDVI